MDHRESAQFASVKIHKCRMQSPGSAMRESARERNCLRVPFTISPAARALHEFNCGALWNNSESEFLFHDAGFTALSDCAKAASSWLTRDSLLDRSDEISGAFRPTPAWCCRRAFGGSGAHLKVDVALVGQPTGIWKQQSLGSIPLTSTHRITFVATFFPLRERREGCGDVAKEFCRFNEDMRLTHSLQSAMMCWPA